MGKKFLVSLVLIILLSTSVNALYFEWGELPGIREDVNQEMTCGRPIDGGVFLRFHIPADVKVKVMLPRAYMMGGPIGNRLATLAKLMNQPENKGTYTECEEAIAMAEVGGDPPPGPYVCIEDEKFDEKSGDVWVEGPSLSEENSEGALSLPRESCCARVPGMVWDGGQLYTEMWPAHSAIVIDGFRAWRGENHYIPSTRTVDTEITDEDLSIIVNDIQTQAAQNQEDCDQYTDDDAKASCEQRNAQIQSDANNQIQDVQSTYSEINSDLEMYTNEFPSFTLASLNLLSNGREGEGDPYYIVMEFNNNWKECEDGGCAEDYCEENCEFNSIGPEWESGLEGWEALETLEKTEFSTSGDFKQWYDYASYRSEKSGEEIPVLGHFFGFIWGFFEGIFGARESICVFGCHDVTVEVDIFTAGLSFTSVVQKELVLYNNDVDPEEASIYSERTDGFVCDFHSDYENVKDLGDYLEDGYKYWCESSGAYLRSDYRITCSSKEDLSCTVNVGNDTSSNMGQSHYANPTQVYKNPERTEENFIEHFTNPTTDWVAGGAGLPIDYAALISDFDPDKHIKICEGTSCLSDWLNASKVDDDGLSTYSSSGVKVSKFLWKPISESDGKLVVLYSGPNNKAASIYNKNGNLVETCSMKGGSNGYEQTCRFSKPGSEYPNVHYVEVGGSNCLINNPSGRVESCFEFVESSTETTTPTNNNYCCGDDPDDVGQIQMVGDVPYACVMNPDGKYEWVAANGTHQKVPNVNVPGNIYDIFTKEGYEFTTEFDNETEIYKRVDPEDYTIMYDLFSTGDSWYACEGDFTITPQQGLTIVKEGRTIEAKINNETHNYMCTNEGGAGRFVECYGDLNFNSFDSGVRYIFRDMKWSSYSASHGNTFTRIGSFENMPYHYESWNGTTSSAKRAEHKKSLKIDNDNSEIFSNNIPLNDWSGYDYLEGMIWYDTSPALQLDIGKKYYLDEYLINDPRLRDWNIFRIPLSDISTVNSIKFKVDENLYLFDGGEYTFYVDNLNLIKDRSGFCDQNGSTYKWVTDRDFSKEACEGFNLEYSNSMCCGDDGREFYSDVSKGCWNSYLISDDTRFQVVEVAISGQPLSFICRENEPCVYDIPRLDPVPEAYVIDNPNPETYVVNFSVSNGTTSSYTGDKLVVEVFKWEYLATAGKFRYCGNSEINPFDFYEDGNFAKGFDYGSIDYNEESTCLLTNKYYCLNSRGWVDDMTNIESRDIEGETFPAADCKLNSLDPRCEQLDLSERVYVKEMPATNAILNYTYDTYGCCPEDYCWNGVACIEDQSNEAFDDPSDEFTINGEDGFRCIGGEWDLSYRKYTPDGRRYGYCASNEQCFVDKYGVYSENESIGLITPQCIDSDYYFGDYYCETGQWTSRTKFVANLLAEQGGNDYTLFCDSYDVVLNYVGNIGGKPLDEYVDPNSEACLQNFGGITVDDCVNNFCVLNRNGQIAVGTTLNQELMDSNLSFARLFDNFGLSEDDLNRKLERAKPGRLNKLTREDGLYWYYDPGLQAVFFSEFNLRDNMFEAVGKFIVRSFGSLISWLTGSESESAALFDIDEFGSLSDLRFIRNNQMYSDIYYAESSTLDVKAIHNNQFDIYKGKYIDYVAVDYKGVSSDFCDYITNFDRIANPNKNDVACTRNRNTYKVFAKGDLNVWEDLTSKLRVLE